MAETRSDRVMRKLAEQSEQHKAQRPSILPSPNAATNLLIADILLRGASTLFRQRVEKQVAQASVEDPEEAEDLLDGKTLLTTLGLYSASKLATRSPVGLGVVAGGLLLKTLYDRGKARQQRMALKAFQKEKALAGKSEGES
ncbi:MAG: hypothetical protein WBA51_08260 [Erythrobacter sp.]